MCQGMPALRLLLTTSDIYIYILLQPDTLLGWGKTLQTVAWAHPATDRKTVRALILLGFSDFQSVSLTVCKRKAGPPLRAIAEPGIGEVGLKVASHCLLVSVCAYCPMHIRLYAVWPQ